MASAPYKDPEAGWQVLRFAVPTAAQGRALARKRPGDSVTRYILGGMENHLTIAAMAVETMVSIVNAYLATGE